MLLQYGPHFFSTLSEKFGQLARLFWANGLPPPLAKNFPYAYDQDMDQSRLLIRTKDFFRSLCQQLYMRYVIPYVIKV